MVWDGSNWANSRKGMETYDANNNMIEVLRQDWDGSNWVNSERNSYTYDENNNNIEWIKMDWDGSNWVNKWKYTYSYDENNNKIEYSLQLWDGSDWVKYTYSYIPITGIQLDKDKSITYKLSNNYPNPFNPTTKINYSIPKQSNVIIKVFDILGREVATLVNKKQKTGYYEVEWNAANNSSGIYFYRIHAGKFVDTKKMIFMK